MEVCFSVNIGSFITKILSRSEYIKTLLKPGHIDTAKKIYMIQIVFYKFRVILAVH